MAPKAAGLVAKKGYTNIKVFADGIPAWVRSGYPLNTENALPEAEVHSVNTGQLRESLGKVLIVDIRPKKFYAKGWIKGSVKIPLARLSAKYMDSQR